MLMQLSNGGMEERNLDFAAALSRAVNDWQLETFVKPGAAAARRHRGAAGGRRLRRRARSSAAPPIRSFAQVMISPRSSDPLGHRRYWPIYRGGRSAATCRSALHVQGFSGGHASTGSGWPTYYMQEHYAFDHRHAEHA